MITDPKKVFDTSIDPLDTQVFCLKSDCYLAKKKGKFLLFSPQATTVMYLSLLPAHSFCVRKKKIKFALQKPIEVVRRKYGHGHGFETTTKLHFLHC